MDNDYLLKKLDPLGIKESDIKIKTSTNLDTAGNPADVWIVVTESKIVVIPESGAQNPVIIELDRVKFLKIRQTVGSAFLQVQIDNTFIDIVRFSNFLRYRFEDLIIQIDNLKLKEATSDKRINAPSPLLCPKCGLPLQIENASCPRCLQQGSILKRVFVLIGPHTGWIFILLFFTIIGVGLSLIPPQLTRILIDDVLTTKKHIAWLPWIVIALVATAFLSSQINMLVGVISTSIGTKVTFELREKLFKKLQSLSIDYYDQHSVGTLMTRFISDIEAFNGFVTQAGQGFLLNIILILGIGIMLFSINFRLAIYVMIPVPFVVFGTMFFWQKIYPKNFKVWDGQSKMSNFLNNVLSGIKLVKAFSQEEKEVRRFVFTSEKLRDAQRDVQLKTSIFNPLMGFLFGLGGLIVWYAGGKTVLAGTLTLGELMAFLSYIGMFYAPLSNLSLLSNWFSSFTTATHRIFEILDTEPTMQESSSAKKLPGIKGDIEFKNVYFGYEPYQPVIKGVSFKIQAGETIGIVGKSGSGKTTLVNLICKFYEVQKGNIFIDGKNLNEILSSDLRKHIGLVLQEPFLFKGTVADNINYGKPDATLKEIINAAVNANAHEFIMKMSNGYDTWLGERGAGLSGGERQRIGIARALLCNAPVLILDEATSSVDTESEKKIQDALYNLVKGKTSIIVAHRLSTLKDADRIYVIDDGKLIEWGSHKELMDLKGVYYKLIKIQTELTKIEDFK
ncbi:MAG: ABC transporter ATP-binding protein/permease [Candidatus Omnitrophica bacterium]|nr:ABC transporter ATP-binding protein/permease [Candidatus Omnitrophota bacterium]